MHREGILFALGNPLLDISAEVDSDFLKKYDLGENTAILADDKHKNMYDDMVERYNVDFVPGGATQNTIRVAQWLIGVPHSTTFVGCIGKDKYGQILEEKAKEASVNVQYQYHDSEPTGTCAVLITGKNRSLCAYLAAANCFNQSHLQKPEVQALIAKAKYYYISGFPLTVCPEAMLQVAQHAYEHNKIFTFNLSADFLCSVFKEQMLKIIPYVDILFGNETEALAFAKENNFGTTDLKEITRKLAALPKQNGSRARIVVITQGADPTIVFKDEEIHEFEVIATKQEDIVDTNGAGDAFVGGFLGHLVQEDRIDIATCMRTANYCANLIIQRSGCTLPPKQPGVVSFI